MNLYRLENGHAGSWWVIAPDPTSAEKALTETLDKADFGFKKDRKVISITRIAEEIDNQFISDKRLLLCKP